MRPLPADEPRLEVSELGGLWRRELLIDIDGSTDADADVFWLQGPTAFVDLRQPPGRPDFSAVTREADLTLAHRQWLMHQAGFAGQLVAGGEFFEWRRTIDLQPPHTSPDAGTLRYEGDILIERGWYERYVEHWRLQEQTPGPVWALHLRSAGGAHAMLIRVGQRFGWARQDVQVRGSANPVGVEVCLGLISAAAPARPRSRKPAAQPPAGSGRQAPAGERWTIQRSSIPYREGRQLSPVLTTKSSSGRAGAGPSTLVTSDVDGAGVPTRSLWTIVSAEGEPSL